MFGAISFAKVAGRKLREKLSGKKGAEALQEEVDGLGLDSKDVKIEVGDDGKVGLFGMTISQEMKEKIILAVGNVNGISEVEDNMEAAGGGTASQFHEVVSGDTLWGVSKKYYGKGGRYMEIYEANRPMLTHPDKIYVGQMLRIPMSDSASV